MNPELTGHIKILGGPKFATIFDKFLSGTSLISLWNTRFQSSTSTTLRRLATINDVDGKLRVVAILYYWSQTVLKPYHDFMMKL